MNVQVATAADGQFQFSLTVDGNPAGEFGRVITSLKWIYEAIGSSYRISIVDNITSELFWSFSDIPGAGDTNNTLNGETTLANILAEVKTAWNDPGGGGGGGGGNVNVVSSVLPTGAATEVTLALVAASLGLLDDVLQTVADTTIIPTRNLQVGGYDVTNARAYAMPVTVGNATQNSAQRMVMVGGVRNRSNAAILPITGAQNGEQVATEMRFKGPFRDLALSNAKVSVNTTGGYLYGYHIINPNATDVYIKIYSGTFASVTVGVTATVWTIRVPANGEATMLSMPRPIIRITTGITIACVTGVADSSAAAPASPVFTQLIYSSDDQ